MALVANIGSENVISICRDFGVGSLTNLNFSALAHNKVTTIAAPTPERFSAYSPNEARLAATREIPTFGDFQEDATLQCLTRDIVGKLGE
ncbi:hypothetical protein [Bradyrhizobium genosp. SA-3]|uniref:hypothetical protein n=1 Tax=Bradyrhizobium genosp. SA-3 TaxID=508868 RepID=UPI00102A0133|nr:hypothetical protein [Bradyrhizobium genosp. SA-3]